jgi:two-component system sensor histidine kinase UhpB
MKSRSLLTQVLAVNLLLVATTVLVMTVGLGGDRAMFHGRDALVLVGAVVATLLGNWLVLRRRFEPLDRLISDMEEIDLSHAHLNGRPDMRADSAEVRRLEATFRRMISRLESERREAGKAAIRAQERERQRIAQDLHDEVNQALTAVSLRLQASIEQAPPALRRELNETKRLSSQAMEELLTLARSLRPTLLDTHGLLPALHSQVRDFAEQTRISASFYTRGPFPKLTPEQQLVIYRVTQESLSNIAQHADAHNVEVELSFIGRTLLRISDDGRGFDEVPPATLAGGLGLSGMRERALLAGGQLSIWSQRAAGTRVELSIG